MSDEVKGWRAVPPALAVALFTWCGFSIFRGIYIGTHDPSDWSARIGLAGEGVAFTGYTLGLIGALELARRAAGTLSLAAKIVACAFAVGLGLELFGTLLSFDMKWWQKEWLRYVFDYGYVAIWYAVAGALAWAVWPSGAAIAIAGVVLVVVGALPPVIERPLIKAIASGYKGQFAFSAALDVLRMVGAMLLVVIASRGVTPTDRPAGAEGLRMAARAMWLRVIAALSVLGLTLLMVMSMSSRGGGDGMIKMFKFVTISAQVVTVLSFVMFGVGVAKTARATIANLPRYPLALAGAGSLWCAGVSLAQLPWAYRMLYKTEEYGGSFDRDYASALSLVMPLVAIATVGFVAFAIGKLATERSTISLQSEAQGKGIGIIFMMLAQVSIVQWMLPKATSTGSAMALMLFAGIAGLISVMMLARLCASGAEEIEREPGIPTASVIPPG